MVVAGVQAVDLPHQSQEQQELQIQVAVVVLLKVQREVAQVVQV